MPRAHRYYSNGLIWHLTHRCHKKEHLLKSRIYRRRYIHWLFEACKRYDLCVLNYCVTCNHIHLLVYDQGKGEISRSMQLMAGRTAQEYNNTQIRNGAFWDDRYHATAIENGLHLLRCSSYIDFNMIRAGAVSKPDEWEANGYRELVAGKKRYRIINREKCAMEFGYRCVEEFSTAYCTYIQKLLDDNYGQKREPEWTESIAVGSEQFIENIQQNLKYIKKAWPRRLVTINENTSLLREPEEEYTASKAYIPEFGIISGI